jgi:hypothetical protein
MRFNPLRPVLPLSGKKFRQTFYLGQPCRKHLVFTPYGLAAVAEAFIGQEANNFKTIAG